MQYFWLAAVFAVVIKEKFCFNVVLMTRFRMNTITITILIIGWRQVWSDILVWTLGRIIFPIKMAKEFWDFICFFICMKSAFAKQYYFFFWALHVDQSKTFWQPSLGSSGAWSPSLAFLIFSALYALRQYAINLNHPKLVPGCRPVSCILARLIASPRETGGWENNRMCRTAAHRGTD